MSKVDSNHLHKLKRHRYKTGAAIYFCVNDCSFRVATNLALGKTAECWRCGKGFRMNNYSITLDKPHCEECHQHKSEGLGRRKKLRRKSDEPLVKIAEASASSLVNELKDKLDNLLTGETSTTEPLKETSKIVEFNIENEEDFL